LFETLTQASETN